MISTMAYVLVAFPLPSETFIADEGVSLYDVNVKPCILYMQEGNRSKIHPSAQKLLEKADSFKVGVASKLQAIRSFSRLFLRSPIRVLGIFKLILNNPHRWLYIQALSAADWCVRQKVEFLHAHFAGDNLIYASAISDWTGIPYGVTTHRYDIFEDPLERKTVIQLFEKASAVITISEFNRSYMVNKYGLSYEKNRYSALWNRS